MKLPSKNIRLIIGVIFVIAGIIMISIFNRDKLMIGVAAFLLIAGAMLISRVLKNPKQNRNRLPDIRQRYKMHKRED